MNAFLGNEPPVYEGSCASPIRSGTTSRERGVGGATASEAIVVTIGVCLCLIGYAPWPVKRGVIHAVCSFGSRPRLAAVIIGIVQSNFA